MEDSKVRDALDSAGRDKKRGEPKKRRRRRSRQAATERLSTPDQLDQVVEVASFPYWLTLGALMVVVATGLGFALFVQLPVSVSGDGILISVGGIQTVTSNTDGRLVRLVVERGDQVQPDQKVAEVAQPLLEQRLLDRRAEVREAEHRRDEILAFHERLVIAQAQTFAKEREFLDQHEQTIRKKKEVLENRLQAEERLLLEQIISPMQVADTKTLINGVEDELVTIENNRKRLEKLGTDSELEREREVLALDLELADLERQVSALQTELERRSQILSPYAGEVVEIQVKEGEIVEKNGPIVSLLPLSADDGGDEALNVLQAILYVPPAEGKKIRPDMPVQLALSSIKREEYGYMLGRVVRVAEIPSTTEGMMRNLQNAQLVQQLSRDHAPFEVEVALTRDPETPSQYAWSSSEGPKEDIVINVGTLCTGEIITEEKRPIEILIPFLGRLFKDEE